jgi:hypothetical protein
MNQPRFTNPLARHLSHIKDDEDAQAGMNLLKNDFFRKGKAEAPERVKELDGILGAYVKSYNDERPRNPPQLRHMPSTNRVYADNKFAVVFEPIILLESFQLRRTVGPHLGFIAMTAGDHVPQQIPELMYIAYSDDSGFGWYDEPGSRHDNNDLVNEAMGKLAYLIS